MDLLTLLGLIVGVGGIVFGNAMEGGQTSSLLQLAAALIVFGGTLGATLVANTLDDVSSGLMLFLEAFKTDNTEELQSVAKEIVFSAQLARRESILAVENRLPKFNNNYMKNVFRFMIDGTDPAVLKDVFERDLEIEEARKFAGAKVWSDAGGFAPTIGIIGAVLGLIQVMANLTDTSALGQGIAVAFVATIYGVGSANLIFIPIANKIRRKVLRQIELKQIIIDGAVAILTELNPYIIEEKIRSYTLKNTDKMTRL
ncbi:MAG: flagellar motor protein [Bdellovibrionales bacterium]|nr:flagellar motor protein [Bdellovibrionales bacterium]